ncbi:MAG: restriction endonuclease subunit R [Candidatus Raymondbacteria bacterium RifOxyB12_full_50_8]|nr:MAG: restriction endonuclease subunit R [Candidatus Raymondbacteria bacterium RifOxyB12_full_50_8]
MKEQAYKDISDLVKRFEEQYASYKSGDYNETATRRDFIDPFFKALGWDIDNSQGAAEAYREVIHEDKVTVGEQKKSPDYSFRLPGGKRLFFVEAKKPSVFIKEEISPAYQIKRYAWSAKLPISILTDFEEFAVYDCTTKPKLTDKASLSRIKYLTFREYLAEFDFLWDTFAKENVIRGSFDKFVLSDKNKKGTATVDKEFLASLDEWRKLLAVDISKNNKKLDEGSINYAVQQTIDRIIFLRICEDRGIEPSERLKSYVADKHCYQALFEYFREADKKYNSGLFDFKKDKLSEDLTIDDKVLKEIIRGLYYPECPFEFSVLPVEILGSAYEQFLGKVIRLTAGHNAKVEEKPEVRKAGGVYYTPQYIVEYIVKNTVGKLVEGKTPDEVEKIKIVDPACGSGSFLLGAYQFLLDWHILYYSGASKKAKAGCITPEGGLTTALKKKILLNNIYGVDLDAQAVEVTKLSLLLKCMEGETQASIQNQLSMFHERVLPTLEANIKCGNSLVGTDFDNSLFKLDDEAESKIRPFDWKVAFPEVFKQNGFDAVIGNPPYVRQELLGNSKEYFQKVYKVYNGTADLYSYFIERGMTLLNPGGIFGIIVANKWMRANYGEPLRKWLIEKDIIEIVDFGDLPVFENATTYPCILIADKNCKHKTPNLNVTAVKTLDFNDLGDYVKANRLLIKQDSLNDSGWNLVPQTEQNLLKKLQKVGIPLGEYVKKKIYYGIKTGLNEAFVIDSATKDKLIKEDKKSSEVIKPFLFGRDIKRYESPKSSKYIIYLQKGFTKNITANFKEAFNGIKHRYPAIMKYLIQFEQGAKARYDQGDYWWEIRSCDYYTEFEQPKIAYAEIGTQGQFIIDRNKAFFDTTAYILASDSSFLLGLLNSRLTTFFFKSISSTIRGGFLRWKFQYVQNIPVIQYKKDEKSHLEICSHVDSLIDLKNKLTSAKLPAEQEQLKNRIISTDRKIDKLVYELYGLTEDEIKIVEESSK